MFSLVNEGKMDGVVILSVSSLIIIEKTALGTAGAALHSLILRYANKVQYEGRR
jgi:hypothetical protein